MKISSLEANKQIQSFLIDIYYITGETYDWKSRIHRTSATTCSRQLESRHEPIVPLALLATSYKVTSVVQQQYYGIWKRYDFLLIKFIVWKLYIIIADKSLIWSSFTQICLTVISRHMGNYDFLLIKFLV